MVDAEWLAYSPAGVSGEPRASLMAELDCASEVSRGVPTAQIAGAISFALAELPIGRRRRVQYVCAHVARLRADAVWLVRWLEQFVQQRLRTVFRGARDELV